MFLVCANCAHLLYGLARPCLSLRRGLGQGAYIVPTAPCRQLWHYPTCQESVALYLKGDATNSTHIPPFEIIIRNQKDTRKDFRAQGRPSIAWNAWWGFDKVLPLRDVSVDSGYLREDGTLCVRVEIGRKRYDASHKVVSDLLALLEQPGSTSDITLTAGGRSFQLHRAILAARCDFFKTMFASDFPDGSSREVPLPDADPDALNLLLRFIYGGVLEECSGQLLKHTLELADQLLLPEACNQVEQWLVDEVGPQTIVQDMLWAERCGRDSLIRNLEAAYVQKHVRDVSAADVKELANGSPELMARLHTATVESMPKR